MSMPALRSSSMSLTGSCIRVPVRTISHKARADQAARLHQRPRQPLPGDAVLEERAREPRFVDPPA